MLGLFPLFALNQLFSALFKKKKTALLLTNQNGEIFSCIVLGEKKVSDNVIGIPNEQSVLVPIKKLQLYWIETVAQFLLAFCLKHNKCTTSWSMSSVCLVCVLSTAYLKRGTFYYCISQILPAL